jgi:hypothetical protein
VYPQIPITDPAQTAYIKALDRVSFRQYVEKIAGGPLYPHIQTAIEYYCWSSLGARPPSPSACWSGR